MKPEQLNKIRSFVYTTAILAVLAALAMLMVLRDSTPPDPNSPLESRDGLKNITKNVAELSMRLEILKNGRKITEQQQRDLLAEYAREQAGIIKPRIRRTDAFDYGNLLRTAQEWQSALEQYRVAAGLYKDKNEDLYINTLLRIAHCLSAEGKLLDAITTARESFASAPGNKAGILYAVYLEIVPAGLGKGHDLQLAALIEEAIQQMELAVVEPHSAAGIRFLSAKPHHIRKAWDLAMSIYSGSGDPALVSAAEKRRLTASVPAK